MWLSYVAWLRDCHGVVVKLLAETVVAKDLTRAGGSASNVAHVVVGRTNASVSCHVGLSIKAAYDMASLK